MTGVDRYSRNIEEAMPIPHTHTGGMDRRVRELEKGARGKALERNLGSLRRYNKEGVAPVVSFFCPFLKGH